MFEEIPLELVFNWDHTGIHYVPAVSNWTLEKVGTKQIKIAGLDDKWQITVIFAGNMAYSIQPLSLSSQKNNKYIYLAICSLANVSSNKC